MTHEYHLMSHHLCPYVQRAAIVLDEKNVEHQRTYIDLSNKPLWFLDISPLGKVPVLVVGDQPIFESAVICEYLDEVTAGRLHPVDALDKARHRAWIEFGSSLLNDIGRLYNAKTNDDLKRHRGVIRTKFERLDAVLGDGSFFAGDGFCIVDATFGPIFRYFNVLEPTFGIQVFTGLARVNAWRAALQRRPSVRDAVPAGYEARLTAFLAARGSAISRRMATIPIADDSGTSRLSTRARNIL